MIFLFEQIRTFFFMMVFGFFTGLLFNVYQLIIHKYKISRFLIHISDLFLGILLGSLGFLLLIFLNNGSIRFYIILAVVFGFTLFFLLTSLVTKKNN